MPTLDRLRIVKHLVINADEAVTVPNEWTGVFETEGHSRSG